MMLSQLLSTCEGQDLPEIGRGSQPMTLGNTAKYMDFQYVYYIQIIQEIEKKEREREGERDRERTLLFKPTK